uniref:Uncharacterized protein n=1 Tax=Arundo donax TaxID=35708 RepID=A0A0A9CCT4_ARUDO
MALGLYIAGCLPLGGLFGSAGGWRELVRAKFKKREHLIKIKDNLLVYAFHHIFCTG